MSLTPEQEKELSQFPPVLRALIDAELAAGNTIGEIGHSFPAPPAGAYVKFTRKVSTRPRASGEGLDHRERNSSISSGEFTDAKRFYFVVEPPDPPPPEPDMDAIRQALAPKPDPLLALSERSASSVESLPLQSVSGSKKQSPRKPSRKAKRPTAEAKPASSPGGAFRAIEGSDGARYEFHFRDRRSPQEIQFELERSIGSLFKLSMEAGQLVFRMTVDITGGLYHIELRFTANLQFKNCYTLSSETSWAGVSPDYKDYYRKTAGSWFQSWTREFVPATPHEPSEGRGEHYLNLCEVAMHAEDSLNTVEAIQQSIVDAMRKGARYSTSHKEGGSNLFWRIDRFVRSDYGDYPDLKVYADDVEFLKALCQFFQWEIQRAAGKTPFTDYEVWKLLWRRLRFT